MMTSSAVCNVSLKMETAQFSKTLAHQPTTMYCHLAKMKREVTYEKPGFIQHSSNVAVKWLSLMFHIQEVPSSNLGPGTSYAD
jgi:hypothetical protein